MPRLPLYREVKEKLIQALAAGEWRPGAKIPIERDLARRFGVGIATVRAAVSELEAGGILARRQGKGTFVSEHARRGRYYRFFNLVNADGTRETPVRKFVSLSRGRATPAEAEFLRLSRYGGRRDVYRLRSTFSIHGTVAGVSDATVPAGLFPRMTRAGVRDGSLSLYAQYQSNYNVNVIAVSADLSVANVPADVARLLGLKGSRAALRIERKAYTYADVPVELRITWVNTSDFRFHIDQGSTV
ncbi:MAG: GntR family transcriptional regulator [Burkholderiales bacterium]|nr:GntR family transcriptional regulator [Burkholderiales bacterium]